jgi:ABC-type multidrug transport system fused ATPase/permease subunit
MAEKKEVAEEKPRSESFNEVKESTKGSQKLMKGLEDSADWLSKAFFLFLNPIFTKGAEGTLEHVDLGPTAIQDRCDFLHDRFIKFWEEEKKLPPKKRSLWRVLWRTSGYEKLILGVLLYAIYQAEAFGPIEILNRLVKSFEGIEPLSTTGKGVLVALIFVLPMTGSIFAAHSNAIFAHIGLQMRNVMITMIYRKALKLSPAARQVSSTGQIVNMFSNDTQQLQRFLFFFNGIVLALPTIGVCLYLIYQQMNVATFVGLGLILILMPLNGVVFGVLNMLRRKKVLITDIRVKLMNEVLAGIRILKYYAWEKAFSKKVAAVRDSELDYLKISAYLVAVVFTILLQAVPVFMPILIFFTYVKLGNTLDSARAFTSIALFNLMQFPFIFLPMGMSQYSQSLVSCKRILEFLDAEELEPYVDEKEGEGGVLIEMKDASLGWILEEHLQKTPDESTLHDARISVEAIEGKKLEGQASDRTGKQYQQIASGEKGDAADKKQAKNSADKYQAITQKDVDQDDVEAHLGDIELVERKPEDIEAESRGLINRSIYTLSAMNFQIRRGELVAVVGAVGSGKSSILASLLGEMHLQSGFVRCSGSIAYCDQRPWILNDTVQGNILFGKPYNETKFDMALYAANLEDDIKVLPGGLHTQIGERGINLSGGQKARVALARAIYQDSDVYLLDDPLSAVDAHVGQFLFQECICKTLATKTRILVTHHVHYLPRCDRILVVQDGRIKFFGNYEEFKAAGVELSEAQEADKPEESDKKAEEEDNGMGKSFYSKDTEEDTANQVHGNEDSTDADSPDATERERKPSVSVSRKEELAKAAEAAEIRKKDTRSATLITKEERKAGDVEWSVYKYYIQSGGVFWACNFAFFSVLAQLFQLLGAYWLQWWGTVSIRREFQGDPMSTERNMYWLNIYTAFGCCSMATYAVRSTILAKHRLGTSEILHQKLLDVTLTAPISFFDTTPVGRILNRFSSDLVVIDEELTQTISQFSNSVVQVLGAVGAIAGSTKGTFLALFVPLMFFYNRLQRYFRHGNTTVARLESVSRSPIYADFSQALAGISSIRAYGEEQRFVDDLEKAVNHNSIANITQQLSSNWLAIRLDFIGSLVSFFIALLAVTTTDFIPAGKETSLPGPFLFYSDHLPSSV